MTYTTPILLTGDQVAGLTGQPVNQGNPGDANFGMVLPGVDALAGPQATFRLVWFQNLNTSATNFSNGQVWRLERYTGTGDPTTDNQNWAQVPGYQQLSPKNDLVSNVGGGDEYIVFDAGGRFLLYNLNGALPTEPTTLFYPGTAQNGDPTLGDNDGELDFADSYRAYQPVCFCAGTGARPLDRAAPDLPGRSGCLSRSAASANRARSAGAGPADCGAGVVAAAPGHAALAHRRADDGPGRGAGGGQASVRAARNRARNGAARGGLPASAA